ncbi:MAG: hypothetical protein ACK5HL_00755 [Bacilli bacterium]
MSKIKFSKKIAPKMASVALATSMLLSSAPTKVEAQNINNTPSVTATTTLTTQQYLDLVKKSANSDKIEDFMALGIHSTYTGKPLLEGASQEKFMEFKRAMNRLYNINLNDSIDRNYLQSQDVKDLKLFSEVLGDTTTESINIEWNTQKQLGEGVNARWGSGKVGIIDVRLNEIFIESDKAAFMLVYFAEAEEFIPYLKIGPATTDSLNYTIGHLLLMNDNMDRYNNAYISTILTNNDKISSHLDNLSGRILNNEKSISSINNVIDGSKYPSSPVTELPKLDDFVNKIDKTLTKMVKDGKWDDAVLNTLDGFITLNYNDKIMTQTNWLDVQQEIFVEWVSNGGDFNNRKAFDAYLIEDMKKNGIINVDEKSIKYFLDNYNAMVVGNKLLLAAAMTPGAYNDYENKLRELYSDNVDIACKNNPDGSERIVNNVDGVIDDNYIKTLSKKVGNNVSEASKIISGNDYLKMLYFEYVDPFGYTFDEFIDILKNNNVIDENFQNLKSITNMDAITINVKFIELNGVVLDSTKTKNVTRFTPEYLDNDEKEIWAKALNSNLFYQLDPTDIVNMDYALDTAKETLQYEPQINNKFSNKKLMQK